LGFGRSLDLLGAAFAALRAALEHHFDGDVEKQDSACDPEARKADSEPLQHRPAEKREEHEDRPRDQRGADRHRAAVGGRSAAREAREDRRAARRIDDHQEGDERRSEKLDHRPSGSPRPSRRHAATSVLRISMAMVIGPTPPGTGVMAAATSAASSKATSPTSLPLPSSAAIRLMPTSTTVAPALIQ